MRFREFLAEEGLDDARPSSREDRKYFAPLEVMSREQWRAVRADLDFTTHIHHPGQPGAVVVQPDERYHDMFKIASTSNIRRFMRVEVTPEGHILSKIVFEKGEPGEDGRQSWNVVN
jgi:hypothetical protein